MTVVTATAHRTPTTLGHRLRDWTLNPDRTDLVTLHGAGSPDTGQDSTAPIELAGWPLAADGALATDDPTWTVAASPGWRLLDWAGPRHLALWRPANRNRLWVLDLADPGSRRHRIELLGRPIRCRLSPTGELLVLIAMSARHRNSRPELCLYRADSDSYLPVADSGGVRGVGAWDVPAAAFAADLDGTRFYRYGPTGCTELDLDRSHDIRIVATTGSAGGRVGLTGTDPAGEHVPGVLDLATGRVDWYRGHTGSTAVELAPSGSRLLVSTWDQQRFAYQVLDPAGRRTGRLDPGTALVTDVRFARDEHHVIGRHQSPADPPQLSRWALTDPRPHPLEPRTRRIAPAGMRWRHRWVPDVAGPDLPEWVFEPTGGPVTGTVLFLHGGPRGRLKPEYDPVIDALVRAGWTVVGPNYPGSSGYGARYLQLGRGDWGGIDAEALQRRLVALHAAAEGRPVCVYGQSYGGYLALRVAAALPHLVAGLAVWAPVTDLPELSAELTGVRRSWLDAELGDLRSRQEVLWERSPVSQAAVLAGTRLLVGHGRADDRCPVGQSRRLVDQVRQQGGGIRYVEEPGGHAPADWGPWSRAVIEHFAEPPAERGSGGRG